MRLHEFIVHKQVPHLKYEVMDIQDSFVIVMDKLKNRQRVISLEDLNDNYASEKDIRK